MIQSFITSFTLKNTYRVNSILFSIKQLPLIGKILPNSLYNNAGLKTLGNIVSGIIEIGSIFLGKILYILVMIMAALSLYKNNASLSTAQVFVHIFVFLTIAGAFLNTYMFNPTKDKYYAMILMHMDAKKYTLSNYYYAMLKVCIGFLPFTILFGLSASVPLWICIVLPLFVVMMKLIVSYYCLADFAKTQKARNENLPTKVLWLCVGFCLLLAYGLPFLGIAITPILFLPLFLLSIPLGLYSLYKINHFTQYKKMYKQLLLPDTVYMVQKQASATYVKENVAKQIVLDDTVTSNRKGFAYFHDLFVKRHRKILTDAVKKQTFVICLIFALLFLIIKVNPACKPPINKVLMTYLPYFVFVMYMLNRGATVTQALFMNCDYSMLTYRIYRTPKVILGLFKERLKTFITINLYPSFVIALGLPLLLWITGGTENGLNYLILFISILAMSIFFSVHYLIMYYLLQPYNIHTELKSSTYKVVQMVTYLVCYYMIQIQVPTLIFGIIVSLFSIIYCLVSLVLVYRLAPKTFKLRV